MIKFPQIISWKGGKPIQPAFVSLVDLKSPTRKTQAGPALAFMKSYGLDVAMDNAGLMNRIGMDQMDFTVDDQDSVYLTKDELKSEGYHALVSANLNGMYSFKVVQELFLHHPVIGLLNRKTPLTAQNSGCDFCLWILYVAKVGVNDNIIADTDIGPVAAEMTCTYNPNDPVKAKNCPYMVKMVRKRFARKAKRLGERPHQYINSPGCEDSFYSFGER
jgi:hypothetical protein